ncbi:MAG: TetR/AcrR family transcriptional regulator [Bacteroidota bacterium]
MKLRDDRKTEQISKAVLGLVKQKGLAGITMGEIAKEAGMATGTLYIYFKNKEELINHLFFDCRKEALENYFLNYDLSKPFKSGFHTVWMNILNFRIQNFEEVVFMDQCYHSPFINECTMKLAKEMKKPLFKLIERGKEEGVFKDMDTMALLTFMIGSIHEGVKNAHYNQKPLNNTDITSMFKMCWDGMKK